MRNRIKIRNSLYLVIIGFCITEAIILPIIANGQQKNNNESEFTTNDIYDYTNRKVILFKKHTFDPGGAIHRFYVELKEGVEYVARIKITAEYGGTFLLRIQGLMTSSSLNLDFIVPVKKYVMEVVYTSDTSLNRYVEVIYTPPFNPEYPTYTLYFNKAGFAGWWWILISGIGALAVLIFVFTFMIIGLMSAAKRKKKKKRKK